MSIESMSIALHHSQLAGTAKLVLIGIANHDGDGGAWPTVDTLAKYAGVNRRNVQRALERLEAAGEIKIIRNGGGDHNIADSHRPNLYKVTLRCPANCDRTSQHRTRRAIVELVDLPVESEVAVAPPGDDSDPSGVAVAPPKPPTKPTTSVKNISHLPQLCPKGHRMLEGNRYCEMGCFAPIDEQASA